MSYALYKDHIKTAPYLSKKPAFPEGAGFYWILMLITVCSAEGEIRTRDQGLMSPLLYH